MVSYFTSSFIRAKTSGGKYHLTAPKKGGNTAPTVEPPDSGIVSLRDSNRRLLIFSPLIVALINEEVKYYSWTLNNSEKRNIWSDFFTVWPLHACRKVNIQSTPMSRVKKDITTSISFIPFPHQSMLGHFGKPLILKVLFSTLHLPCLQGERICHC